MIKLEYNKADRFRVFDTWFEEVEFMIDILRERL